MKIRTELLCALLEILLLVAGPAIAARAQNPFLQKQSERVITEIRIEGNEHTKDYVLQRELGFDVGDVYDDDALNDAWYRLEQLEFIAYVDITMERPADGEIEIHIHVEEDKRFLWDPILRYTRRFDWAYGGRARMINFRGRSETVWAEAWWGHRHHYALGWQNPWSFGKAELGLGAMGYFEDYNFVFLPFDFQDAGGRFEMHRNFLEKLRVSADYTYRSVVVYNAAVPTILPEPGTTTDPYIGVGLEWDSRNLRYYPSRGIHAIARGVFGSVGGDLDSYTYYDLHLAGFTSVPKVGILAGRVTHRGTSDALPVYERSYLGGPEDVRGIEFSSLRGDRHFIATVELRRPIFLVPLREGRAVGLGVHGFGDWGQAWDHDFDTSKVRMRYSGGVGVHLNLNTYNLRFEWAWTDHDGNAFQFADSFNF